MDSTYARIITGRDGGTMQAIEELRDASERHSIATYTLGLAHGIAQGVRHGARLAAVAAAITFIVGVLAGALACSSL